MDSWTSVHCYSTFQPSLRPSSGSFRHSLRPSSGSSLQTIIAHWSWGRPQGRPKRKETALMSNCAWDLLKSINKIMDTEEHHVGTEAVRPYGLAPAKNSWYGKVKLMIHEGRGWYYNFCYNHAACRALLYHSMFALSWLFLKNSDDEFTEWYLRNFSHVKC